MIGLYKYKSLKIALLVITMLIIVSLSACSSSSTKGAVKGGATGAISGAVGGLFSALVFGGDPVDRAARGAVYAGAVGATHGAIAGSQVDDQIQQKKDDDSKKLKEQIGNDAFSGLTALANCDHKTSLNQAKIAQKSDNPNYKLSGLWLEVITYGDSKQEPKARAKFPELVKSDWNLKTNAEAEENMRKTLNELIKIREEYDLPRVCS